MSTLARHNDQRAAAVSTIPSELLTWEELAVCILFLTYVETERRHRVERHAKRLLDETGTKESMAVFCEPQCEEVYTTAG